MNRVMLQNTALAVLTLMLSAGSTSTAQAARWLANHRARHRRARIEATAQPLQASQTATTRAIPPAAGTEATRGITFPNMAITRRRRMPHRAKPSSRLGRCLRSAVSVRCKVGAVRGKKPEIITTGRRREFVWCSGEPYIRIKSRLRAADYNVGYAEILWAALAHLRRVKIIMTALLNSKGLPAPFPFRGEPFFLWPR